MDTACLTEEQIRELAAARQGRDVAPSHEHLDKCSACRGVYEEWCKNLDYMSVLRGALQPIEVGEISGDPLSMLREIAGPDIKDDRPETRPVIPGYELIREVHRGGQGIVYEAVQLSTRRTVAVKVLLEGGLASERDKWRFEREVRLVAALKHPNIVVIHDSGIADGRYYFAMDYVAGQPLDTHVRLKAPTVKEIVPLFRQVCDAVAHAHGRGVIHRDLKPGNILVREDGQVCVLDFGLAKVTGNQIMLSQRGLASIPGNIMGTLRYMAPEQTLADPDAVDVRTDIYSLGVILFELLTGQPPYKTGGDLAEALRNIREVDPPRPSSLRREAKSELDAIVLEALAKEPDRRYQTTSQLADDLAAWMDGRPISAKSDSSFYVLRKLVARHYFYTSVLTALVASIIGFGGITYHALERERQKTKERDISNAALKDVDQTKQIADLGVREFVHQMKTGWFFDHWHAGRMEPARAIRDELPPDAPERAAMSFLLDGYPIEQLRGQMPAGAAPLMQFVIGERYAAAGDLRAAREAFELSLEAATRAKNRWWQTLAKARLDQLRVSGQSESSTRGS